MFEELLKCFRPFKRAAMMRMWPTLVQSDQVTVRQVDDLHRDVTFLDFVIQMLNVFFVFDTWKLEHIIIIIIIILILVIMISCIVFKPGSIVIFCAKAKGSPLMDDSFCLLAASGQLPALRVVPSHVSGSIAARCRAPAGGETHETSNRKGIYQCQLLVEHIEITLGVGAASKEREGIDPSLALGLSMPPSTWYCCSSKTDM
ncbi:hypothetical protein EYF80_024855 [Liparis tanakae]|uniref:Uncharacterized protein n=1 Tax=Liparis tanakae TaxID=230148 RepID=A0A4Z2HH85_9TELE|nr:hypothetical protein EYF80_024855 [Liparis tanakae]